MGRDSRRLMLTLPINDIYTASNDDEVMYITNLVLSSTHNGQTLTHCSHLVVMM